MITVDAQGLSCPEPVMLSKAAAKDHPSEEIQVKLDNATARDNVLRMARSIKRATSVQESDEMFIVTIAAAAK